MRSIFMGSSDFAVESLKAMVEAGYEVNAVVSQPDKPKGRGYTLTPTPVKAYALTLDIPVYTPDKIKNGELQELLDEVKPDVIIVAAYGKILPPYILNYPPKGCINVHASLLPKYRGAAPINFCLIDGEEKTGVTTMLMDEGLDTGDMLLKAETEITADDDVGTLHDRLAEMGGKLLVDTLKALEEGTLVPEKQTGESCYASMITNETRKIDFTDSAKNIVNRVRGLSPIPTAYALCGGKNTKIFKASIVENAIKGDFEFGQVVPGKELIVRAGDGFVRIDEIQPEGKKRMGGADFLRGNKPEKFE